MLWLETHDGHDARALSRRYYQRLYTQPDGPYAYVDYNRDIVLTHVLDLSFKCTRLIDGNFTTGLDLDRLRNLAMFAIDWHILLLEIQHIYDFGKIDAVVLFHGEKTKGRFEITEEDRIYIAHNVFLGTLDIAEDMGRFWKLFDGITIRCARYC
ncbi:hypothetical protein G7054_g6660 [Neopestalotiopsis clavispora]|nr:hypothetical protein G7054_g6660 [Neopestalotiopsis clavispora]